MNTVNHPDAELLALETHIVAEYTAMDAKKGKTDDETDAWVDRLDVLERQFANMPVLTLDGVAAKLRRAGTECTGDWGGQLVKTALVGLERVLEARGQTDAELLRLGDEHKTFLGEIDAGGHDDAKGDVLDEATEYRDILEAKIAATPANTFAGLAVKLRIGVDNLPMALGTLPKGEEASTDELNLMSALADAERLAGARHSRASAEGGQPL